MEGEKDSRKLNWKKESEKWCGSEVVGEIILFYDSHIAAPHGLACLFFQVFLQIEIDCEKKWPPKKTKRSTMFLWMWKYFYLNEFFRLPPLCLFPATKQNYQFVLLDWNKCEIRGRKSFPFPSPRERKKIEKVCRLFEEVIKNWVHFLK